MNTPNNPQPRQGLAHLYARVRGRYQRMLSAVAFQRPWVMRADRPLISFTFDDFPRSALQTGGAILKRHGVRGTYYASLGLMGTEAPTGLVFAAADLRELVEQGHELGCHTFDHCDSWETRPSAFAESVLKNRRALGEICPNVSMKTFSYPLTCPRPRTKRAMAKYFLGCRGGGQTFNHGTADLNNLRAFFLEKTQGDLETVKDLIDKNLRASGWLIFATHDVADEHTRYGCTPKFFEDVVRCSVDSGARVVTVVEALEALGYKELEYHREAMYQ